MDEFEKIGVNQEKYYIIWDNVELPCVSCELKSIKEHLDDVLAVSFDTWLLSEEGDEIIEFYHEGKITYGKIVKEQILGKKQRNVIAERVLTEIILFGGVCYDVFKL